MTQYWKCEECEARFRRPVKNDNTTVLTCPECKSKKIDLVEI